MKKIVVVAGYLNIKAGGAVASACLHAKSLQKRGHKVVVIGFTDKRMPLTLERLGIEQLDVKVFNCSGFPLIDDSQQARSYFENNIMHYDIVHFNGHWSPINYSLAAVCSFNCCPYIISSRGMLSPFYINLFSRQYLSDKTLMSYENIYIQQCYCLHVTSSFEEEQILFKENLNIIKIPNQMDLSDFQKKQSKVDAQKVLGLDNNFRHLIYFSRVIPEKNPDFLIESSILEDANFQLKVHFIGEVASDYKCKLQNFAKDLGVEDSICFHGHLNGEKRIQWLSAGDAFVLPSQSENFCLALVEAVLMGLPAIVSPNIGAIEYLDGCDFIAVPLDLELWRKAITNTLNKDSKNDMSKYSRIKEYFSEPRVMLLWDEVYKNM